MSHNKDDMSNLSANLSGVLNGDKFEDTAINIPYADDEESTPQSQHKHQNGLKGSSETINSVDSAEQAERYKKSISGRKGTNLRIQISRPSSSSESEPDEKNLEAEKLDKPGPLISDIAKSVGEAPALGLRRNSFSMPALNELDLDSLRALHMKTINDEEDVQNMDHMKSKESLSEIHVSEIFLIFMVAEVNRKFRKLNLNTSSVKKCDQKKIKIFTSASYRLRMLMIKLIIACFIVYVSYLPA